MKYASEYFPGSISKQCTLNNHWKYTWSVQKSLFPGEKYVPAVNGFSLNDWDKGYLYCRMKSKNKQSGAFEDISVAGSYRTAPKTSLKTVLKTLSFTKKTILSFSILNLLCAPCAQVSLSFCSPLDCSLPGSSAHGILQARILKWVAISYPRGSSWPRDWTYVSCISCFAGSFFISEP